MALEILHVNPRDPMAATLHLPAERREGIDMAADRWAYDADVHLARCRLHDISRAFDSATGATSLRNCRTR